MGTHWKSTAKRAGYDPKTVVDAPLSAGKIRATIALTDMKHAVIGDGENCSGARCIKRALDADWAYIGATSAFIVNKGSRRITRYLVNGIAKRQDRTMSVVGEEVILRPPPQNATLAAKRAYAKKRVSFLARVGGRKKASESKGKMQHSLAALLRGSD